MLACPVDYSNRSKLMFLNKVFLSEHNKQLLKRFIIPNIHIIFPRVCNYESLAKLKMK